MVCLLFTNSDERAPSSSEDVEECDYINVEGHLEMEYSYNNGEEDKDDDSNENDNDDLENNDLEVTECEDSNDHQNEEGEEALEIQCKGCSGVFESRESFVYHIEVILSLCPFNSNFTND